MPLDPNHNEALLSNLLSQMVIDDPRLDAAYVRWSRTSTKPNTIAVFAAFVYLDEPKGWQALCLFEPNLYEALLSNLLSRMIIDDPRVNAANVRLHQDKRDNFFRCCCIPG